MNKQVNVRLNEELLKKLKIHSIESERSFQDVISYYILYGMAYCECIECDSVEDTYRLLNRTYNKKGEL